MQDENENKSSLFSSNERAEHEVKECALVDKAKYGTYDNFVALMNYWRNKKDLFLTRAIERGFA